MNHLNQVTDMIFHNHYLDTVYNGKLTPSYENTRGYFKNELSDENCYCLGEFNNNELVSYASLSLHKSFFEEIEANISFFYVSPSFRGTSLARDMIKRLLEIYQLSGAKAIYATRRSGYRDDGLWTNLFRKFGFENVGSTMVKFGV